MNKDQKEYEVYLKRSTDAQWQYAGVENMTPAQAEAYAKGQNVVGFQVFVLEPGETLNIVSRVLNEENGGEGTVEVHGIYSDNRQ